MNLGVHFGKNLDGVVVLEIDTERVVNDFQLGALAGWFDAIPERNDHC